ncbi:Calponin homology domain and Smooth muscle protein/calponin family-containing protein [Strongyloides ratti]|uniref:Calponin homology domain and Smooth muscle protein/calponin family-containing protein n=1 Tax=Strongyloides ratti TaxID=34506 RepID=A0A090KYK1_STRRB|nr:Calponin homology domain and Smooth muscle protein/calponin family-containing protein [Strongyloides ratti]CEF62595.1 Calponin homology domain and Smooth muscle protein/calponin family-containing protein [Strongyloides ratti]
MAAGWNKFTGKSPYPELSSNSDHSSVCYGVKTNRNYRLGWIQGKRDELMEQSVIEWIEIVLKKFAPSSNEIGEWLKNGVIICEVLEATFPKSLVRKINYKQSQFSSSENIQNFLESAEKLGIRKDHLFEASDLIDEKDLGKVFRTLNILREKCL